MKETGMKIFNEHHGEYEGRQIVPEDWVTESTTAHLETSFHGASIQYG